MEDQLEFYARAAYVAYCKAVGGLSYNGDVLPVYDALPERIRGAWRKAAEAVTNY